MKRLVEKFYNKLFSDADQTEEVPYANKQFIFWFSLFSFGIVLFFIIKDIIKNIEKINA